MDIFNKDKRLKKKIEKYISTLNPKDKSGRERCKYMLQVEGVAIDDLDTPSREIPFERTSYKETEEDAMSLGKLEWENDNKVEVWKLIRRWK